MSESETKQGLIKPAFVEAIKSSDFTEYWIYPYDYEVYLRSFKNGLFLTA